MKCRSFRKRLFDYRDGTLSLGEINEVRVHLAVCPACRAHFEDEDALARSLRGALEAETLSFEWERRVRTEARPSPIQGPFFRRLAFPLSVGTMIVLAAVIIGPRLLENREPSLVGPSEKTVATSDDLVDPLQDWLEGRMIITVEDRKTGVLETFASTRSGGIASLRSERRGR